MIPNNKNEKKKVIHLMVTSLCNRDCKYCCNKQYSLDKIPYATSEELKNVETLLLTGGEPFAFTNPNEIAKRFKHNYTNIKNIYVYTNALELSSYIRVHDKNDFLYIDGLSVSIKNSKDAEAFDDLSKIDYIKGMSSNRVYVFNNLYNQNAEGFEMFQREWQDKFIPAQDSIFRRI